MRYLFAVLVLPVILSLIPVYQLIHHYLLFNPKSLRNARVVICGASTGVGEALAYRYAERGAHVAILARRRKQLERVQANALKLLPVDDSIVEVKADEESPFEDKQRRIGSVSIVVADLAKSPESAILQVLGSKYFMGEIDILVLNHIIGYWDWWLDPNSIHGSSKENSDLLSYPRRKDGLKLAENILRVNSLSYMALATYAMKALVKASDARRRRNNATTYSTTNKNTLVTNSEKSQLIVVSSLAAEVASPKTAPYAASKHAVNGFFSSLRFELEHFKVSKNITL
eukprot:g3369.t1